MIKKYKKVLFTIVLFLTLVLFGLNTTVNAKEMTLDELANTIISTKPNTTYVYVIGEYVYTSNHLLTTQDTMLAARSIDVPAGSNEYDAMSIIYLEGTYDSNWNLNGLKYVDTLLGTATEPAKYDIKYIDEKEINVNVEIDKLVEEVYNTIDTTTENEKFEVSKEGNTINVTVLDNDMDSILALEGTGIATAAQNLLDEHGVENVTIKIPGTDSEVEISKENLMQKLGELNTLFKKLAGKENATAGDLAGKSIEVTIGLEPNSSTSDETTFTVNFDKREIEVDELVEDVYNTIDTKTENDKFEVSKTGDTINVIVLDNAMESVAALEGTGIATAAENLLAEYGVEEVTIQIPGTAENVVINKDNLMMKLGELNSLFKKLTGKDDGKAGDLAGKSIEIIIGLDPNCTTTDETTFNVLFGKKEVEVSELVNTAYATIDETTAEDKFTVARDGNDINITIVDTTMNSVMALEGTGIATAAETLLEEYGVEDVTIQIPGTENKVIINKENLMSKLGELNSLFKTLTGKDDATAADLIGKSIEINIGIDPNCTVSGTQTFTVNF